jgi:apolipoprotein N-acyltransferase
MRVVEAFRILGILSRSIAAILGGYAVAALASACLAVGLPASPAEAALTGMMASFAVMTGVVVWVFAAATALRAWLGVAIPAAVLGTLFLLLRVAGA